MYVCVRYKESDRSCMYVLDTRRVIDHVCMCLIQESDRSCMYVSDTRMVVGHVCMCQMKEGDRS